MKVLIYAINSKYIHSTLAPWYLARAIADNCANVQCKVLEGTINESIDKHMERLSQEDYDLIGFCTYIWNVDFVDRLCQLIKENTDVVTVLGGPEVGYNVEEHLKKPYVDYVISGEGEEPFSKLCNGESVSTIEGL